MRTAANDPLYRAVRNQLQRMNRQLSEPPTEQGARTPSAEGYKRPMNTTGAQE